MDNKPRDINTLLKLLLKAFIDSLAVNKVNNYKSICNAIYALRDIDSITIPEKYIIREYMYSNRPIKQYYDYSDNKVSDITQFWYMKLHSQHRINWLKKHIKLTNNE